MGVGLPAVKSGGKVGDDSSRPKKGRPLSFDREAALGAAMLAFWRHGYETTSIADLTAAMAITAPSLYAAFGDKKRLFLEAVRLYTGDPAVLLRTIGEAPSAREIAQEMLVSAAHAYTGKSTPRGCLLASATASGSGDAADVQSEVAAIRRVIEIGLRKRIQRDIEEGKLPAHTDASGLAGFTLALLQGLSVLARDGRSRRALVAAARVAMNAWPPVNDPNAATARTDAVESHRADGALSQPS